MPSSTGASKSSRRHKLVELKEDKELVLYLVARCGLPVSTSASMEAATTTMETPTAVKATSVESAATETTPKTADKPAAVIGIIEAIAVWIEAIVVGVTIIIRIVIMVMVMMMFGLRSWHSNKHHDAC